MATLTTTIRDQVVRFAAAAIEDAVCPGGNKAGADRFEEWSVMALINLMEETEDGFLHLVIVHSNDSCENYAVNISFYDGFSDKTVANYAERMTRQGRREMATVRLVPDDAAYRFEIASALDRMTSRS